MRVRFLLAAASVAALTSSSAEAALVISGKATANVSCASGVCTATAKHANLNGDELAAMLADGDVTVASGAMAKDIEVRVPPKLTWDSAHRLGLDAFRAITVSHEIFYAGNGGGMDLKTNDGGHGGALNFEDHGFIVINVNAGTLTIDGASYALIHGIGALAAAILAHPDGRFALSGPYDAAPDGTYTSAPVATAFAGRLEGLGNTIQHLRINVQPQTKNVGLFDTIDGGTVSHLRLAAARVRGGKSSEIGTLAGACNGTIDHVSVVGGQVLGDLGSQMGGVCGALNGGTLSDAHSSAAVTGTGGRKRSGQGYAGGLVGTVTAGLVVNSSASGTVEAGKFLVAGGLVADNLGAIRTSFASGAVLAGDGGTAGGLVGRNAGTSILDCYANGTVQGGVDSTVGGLLGTNNGPVVTSYSAGPVASGSGNAVGGFVGNDQGEPDLTQDYWDIDTSGQSHGAGNDTADPGITGLTHAQFQSGLPTGFDPAVWGQDPAINDGLPYLLAVKP
ncbi:MAG TPA: GLUG motif-containing protein [Rhizomicrobium sp.]|nr:GLUG motif-containing protein [Rhizomicrobium sp.]